MNDKDSVRDFLMSRRARVRPAEAGFPRPGQSRRVPGLRREEVAVRAGVSVEYYTRLERGQIAGASDAVLNALARALQLSEAERIHLFDLAGRAPAPLARRAPAPGRVRESVQRLLDGMDSAAVVENHRADIVATNAIGRLLYSPQLEMDGRPNSVRFAFLDPRAEEYFAEWADIRRMCAAALRMAAGSNPLDEELTALIGELSTRSPLFRQEWAGHHVHIHQTGIKRFRHPEVGPLDLQFDVLEMPGAPGLKIVTYHVAENSPTEQNWRLLASLALTQESGYEGHGPGQRGTGPVPVPARWAEEAGSDG